MLAESCERVTVLDVDPNVLELGTAFIGDNGLDGIDFAEISADTLASLPPSDAILCVGTIQVLSHAEIRQFLGFTRANLRPGGRLLCNTASPRMLVDWTLRLRRLRYDGWRGQLAWAGRLAVGLAHRRVAGDGRRTYCLRPKALIRTVEEHGLRLLRSPHQLRSLDALRQYEVSTGYESPALLPYFDWYVFERPASA